MILKAFRAIAGVGTGGIAIASGILTEDREKQPIQEKIGFGGVAPQNSEIALSVIFGVLWGTFLLLRLMPKKKRT